MTFPDLEPPARQLADLISGISEDMLKGPTACPKYSLGDLVDHVGGLAQAFTGAAKKDTGGAGSQAPSGNASRLGDDWQTRIPRDLAGLAEAWRDPEAWTGMTMAGGVELPGEIAGVVAMDEIVIHGWDVAQATGQPYSCDPASLEVVLGFVSQFSQPGEEAGRQGLFGPAIHLPEDAPLLDRVIGLSGRDPAWSPGP
jgi:uncharacterized protein (TIGR03086 family)